ncbi:DUF6445 family protein [Paucibacter sp. APW11]|uniref:DUF6445 family protein n=1 Tax=Roseateles aquae TaxID=3077235 RepID=A0ABU3PDF5_9BURK|nr:DUF6445 family protein [Paucibacter sp. APW11]MDT9000619.1 DUF6445 family protein [Paucibacter sp. APW11]
MLPMPPAGTPLPPIPPTAPRLADDGLELGRNYWILDQALPNAAEISQRCLQHPNWLLGYPHAQESWPGMRFHGALLPEELAQIEAYVMKVTGAKRLWVGEAPNGAKLDFNVAQLVGARECGPRPHTDRRALCTYAAVLYLQPKPAPKSGTCFYRLRYPNGAIGGNCVAEPHQNLVDALKVRSLPPQAWYEELCVENVFNRLLLYKASLVHSAAGYFGEAKEDRRLTAVFFWLAEH